MGRIPTGSRKYELKHLNERHLEILRFIARGFRNKDIAEALSVSRDTVSNVRNSEIAKPLLQALLKARDEEAAGNDFAIRRLQERREARAKEREEREQAQQLERAKRRQREREVAVAQWVATVKARAR